MAELMDTTTPQGAFLFSMFGALAQYERGWLGCRSWRTSKRPGIAADGACVRGPSIRRNCKQFCPRWKMAS